MGLPLTTAETFPCLPLNNTGFPDSRSPISPLHAFLIAKAPRVTWANRLARPRILRVFCGARRLYAFFLSQAFKNLAPGTWHLAPSSRVAAFGRPLCGALSAILATDRRQFLPPDLTTEQTGPRI